MASGLAVSEVASRTGVSPKSLRRWQQKQLQGRSLEPGRATGGPRKITVADEPALREQVAAMPDATLAEHGAAWVASGHAPVSSATMSRALRRLDLPLKKRR
jgi:transposase